MSFPTINEVLSHAEIECSIIPKPSESLSAQSVDDCVRGAADETGDTVEPLLSSEDREFTLYGPSVKGQTEITARSAYYVRDRIANSKVARVAFFEDHEYGVRLGASHGGTISNKNRLSVLFASSRSREAARIFVAALLHRFQVMLHDQPVALHATDRLFNSHKALFTQNNELMQMISERRQNQEEHVRQNERLEEDAANAEQALTIVKRVNESINVQNRQAAEFVKAQDLVIQLAQNSVQNFEEFINDLMRQRNAQNPPVHADPTDQVDRHDVNQRGNAPADERKEPGNVNGREHEPQTENTNQFLAGFARLLQPN